MADFTNPYINYGSKWGSDSYGSGSPSFDKWFNGGKFGKKFNPNPGRFKDLKKSAQGTQEEEEQNDIFSSSFLRFGNGAIALEGFMTNDNIGGSFPIVLDIKSPVLKSDFIKLLQNALNYLYDDFENIGEIGVALKIDGEFDEKTKAAFKYFQNDKGVTTKNDGVVDQETVRQLELEILKKQGAEFGSLVSQAMIDINNHVSFKEDPQKLVLDNAFWKREKVDKDDETTYFSFLMRKEVKEPALAVLSIFSGNDNILDCQLATQAVYWKAILDYLGATKFNEEFCFVNETQPGLTVSISDNITRRLEEFKYRMGKLINTVDDFIPGDWLVYDNCYEYRFKHPGGGWNHENLIYEGNQRFSGFGLTQNNFKEDFINGEMKSAYKEGRSDYDKTMISFRLSQPVNIHPTEDSPSEYRAKTKEERDQLIDAFNQYATDKTDREPRGFDYNNTLRINMKKLVALKG